jgi:hypothetical protein
MLRLYLMPLIGVGTKEDPRRPKYADTTLAGIPWGAMGYGSRMVTLVGGDVPDAAHALLVNNADVYAFPDGFQDGTTTVSNQSTNLSSLLESNYGIPAQWVQPSSTYLSVAHTIGGMFQFLQRVWGILGTPTDPFVGVTLNDQIRNLPQATQDAIFAAGNSFGWNMSGISNTTTIRNALKYMADQWGASPLYLGGFVF